MTGGPTFKILEGVRRAKAFELAGAATVRAKIQDIDGKEGPIVHVPIEQLLAPYDAIDMSTNSNADRFWRIWRTVKAGQGDQLPPIIVTPSVIGTPLKDLGWSY